MSFDWRTFLDAHGIHYVEKGRNVSKGNLAIKCPICTDDPSEHMNVSLYGYGYACWRDAEHRGHNNAVLVQKLLSCTWSEATSIVSDDAVVVPTMTTFREQSERFLAKYGHQTGTRRLKLPDTWVPLHEPGGVMRSLVLEYVKSRGYSEHDALALAKRYDIHYTPGGSWTRRVLWPVRDGGGKLVNYIGRSISRNPHLRYKTLGTTEAGSRVSDCLFDLHNLVTASGEALVITEGPFDAMRIGWLGETLGVFATCIFTINMSERQLDLVRMLARRFTRTFVLLDNGALLQATRAQTYLSDIGCRRLSIPEGVKDPGELNPSQVLALCRGILYFGR
jgi:hypothetical protein